MSESKKLAVKLLRPGAQMPTYAHEGDSGFDVRWCPDPEADAYNMHGDDSTTLFPGETRKFNTGLAFDIADGYELQVRPRSGMSNRSILCHFGTVDGCFRGEVKAVLTNLSAGDGFVIQAGDRICQLVLAPVTRAVLEQTEELSETVRGQSGWGSSGVK